MWHYIRQTPPSDFTKALITKCPLRLGLDVTAPQKSTYSTYSCEMLTAGTGLFLPVSNGFNKED